MKLCAILTIICIITSALLAITYNLTKDRIRIQEEKAEQDSLAGVVPDAVGFFKEGDCYKAVDKDRNVIGYAFIGEGRGYSSILRIMIGVDTANNIKGIKILSQQETPGLGNRVNEIASERTLWDVLKGKKMAKGEPWFQTQFREKNLDNIQGITGATITTDAVVTIVKNAIERHKVSKAK